MSFETSFFTPDEGVNPVWVQHVFWFLGHFEIYLPLIGAMVIIGLVIVVRARMDVVTRLYAVGGLFFLPGLIVSVFLLQTTSHSSAFHDTYYVTAHLQYGLGLLVIFLVFSLGFWLTRKTYNRALAILQFACTFLGTGLLFFPQLLMSTQGMPRRYVDYENTGFELWSFLTQAGYLCLFAGTALFLILMGHAVWTRIKA